MGNLMQKLLRILFSKTLSYLLNLLAKILRRISAPNVLDALENTKTCCKSNKNAAETFIVTGVSNVTDDSQIKGRRNLSQEKVCKSNFVMG